MSGSHPGKCQSIIVKEQGSEESSCTDQTFIISDALQDTTDQEYDQIYKLLSNANVEISNRVPMYEMCWAHLVKSRHGNLHELVLLSIQLDKALSEMEPDKLICESNLDRGYLSVAKDLADKHDINVITQNQSTVSPLDNIQRFLKNSILILPFLFDELFSLLWKRITREPQQTEIVLIPSLRRINSMLSIIDKIGDSDYENYKISCTSKVSSHGRNINWEYLKSNLAQHSMEPYSASTSINCILRQILAYIQVSKNILFRNESIHDIADIIEDETDIKLYHTIRYSVYEGFRTRDFLSIFFYELTKNVIRQSNCEKLVIGGASPSRRAMAHAAIDTEVSVYLVDHGISVGDSPNLPSELTHLVSGKLEKQNYERSNQIQEPWDWVVTGRPYLEDLYKKYSSAEKTPPNNDRLRILVATQPLPCRHELVEDIISSVNQSPITAEILIKVHPSETKSTYESYSRKHSNVSVADSDLFTRLLNSDVTITIHSNVGIESILAGTPSVCVNKWKPKIPDPYYAEYGPIPILRSQGELSDILTQLDSAERKRLLNDQKQFVHESFELNTDTAENMKKVILS